MRAIPTKDRNFVNFVNTYENYNFMSSVQCSKTFFAVEQYKKSFFYIVYVNIFVSLKGFKWFCVIFGKKSYANLTMLRKIFTIIMSEIFFNILPQGHFKSLF